MNRKKIIGAIAAAMVFMLFLIFLDKDDKTENFGVRNYWIKLTLQGAFMFFIYLLPGSIRNITWKEIFKKR